MFGAVQSVMSASVPVRVRSQKRKAETKIEENDDGQSEEETKETKEPTTSNSKAWTAEEDKQLIALKEAGKRYKDIAEILGRTMCKLISSVQSLKRCCWFVADHCCN